MEKAGKIYTGNGRNGAWRPGGLIAFLTASKKKEKN
jgi:hypothetical protein